MNAGVRRRELPRTHVVSRSRGPLLGGIWLRCTTRWRARELDRQLAAGADPMQSDQLSLRIGQLGSSRSRRRIASALRGAVAMAERDAYPLMMAAPPIQRSAVRASGGLLLEIAERLVSCEPIGVRGVAIALAAHRRPTGPAVSRRGGPPAYRDRIRGARRAGSRAADDQLVR